MRLSSSHQSLLKAKNHPHLYRDQTVECGPDGESEAQKSRYTSDNNAAWLQTGAFSNPLKIWQPNASGFRHYGNYPRENKARQSYAGILCHMLAAPYSHSLGNHSGSVIDVSESHSHQH